MKKLVFALALVSLVSFGAQAQKQMGDEHNIELGFTPLGTGVIDGTVIKYRNFLEDNRAFRVSLMLDNNTDVYVTTQEGDLSATDPVSPQLHDTEKSSMFGLAVGYEMHWDGQDRLSPYWGVEAFFMTGKNSYETESWGANDIDNVGQLEKNVTWTATESQGSNTFGLRVVTGVDFYFTDAMYMGVEAGLGFAKTNVTDYTIEVSDLVAWNLANGAAPDADAPVAIVGSIDDGHLSNTQLGNVFQSTLRIGYLFN
jgi:opacity protein-like surface antigen